MADRTPFQATASSSRGARMAINPEAQEVNARMQAVERSRDADLLSRAELEFAQVIGRQRYGDGRLFINPSIPVLEDTYRAVDFNDPRYTYQQNVARMRALDTDQAEENADAEQWIASRRDLVQQLEAAVASARRRGDTEHMRRLQRLHRYIAGNLEQGSEHYQRDLDMHQVLMAEVRDRFGSYEEEVQQRAQQREHAEARAQAVLTLRRTGNAAASCRGSCRRNHPYRR